MTVESAMIVGLTGGIASGKTLVANEFARLGVSVLEADEVSRDVVAPGSPGLERVLEAFGETLRHADGSLNRRMLREIVFADSDARKRLESIIHPLMRERVVQWRSSLSSGYGIYAAAILIESGMVNQVSRVLVVDTPEEVQKDRLIKRDGVDAVLADQMLRAQSSRYHRLAHAHDVIRNNGKADEVTSQVKRLHKQYLKRASSY